MLEGGSRRLAGVLAGALAGDPLSGGAGGGGGALQAILFTMAAYAVSAAGAFGLLTWFLRGRR